jgi:hypothetical protein
MIAFLVVLLSIESSDFVLVSLLFFVATTGGRRAREAAARSPMMCLDGADRNDRKERICVGLVYCYSAANEECFVLSLCFLSEAPTKAIMNSPRNA